MIAAVVLAGGGSSRFADGHKLLADFRGHPLWTWAIASALDSGLDETIMVTGAIALDPPAGVRPVDNPRWREGLATSLQAAVAACAHHDAIVFGLADQPLLVPSSWRAVADSASPIAIARYSGARRGHPVKLSHDVWAMLPAHGDIGARELMAARPDLVEEIDCEGDPVDIDTVEDLKRWS